MTDFSENSPAALLRIVHPVIARHETGIHAIMQRQRLIDWFEECFHLQRQGSESAVETNHEQQVAAGCFVSVNDLLQVDFIQAEGLFAEHMLTGRKCCHHLSRVQVMASGDHDRIDVRIVDYPIFIASAVSESKFLGGVTRMRTVSRTDANHFYATNVFKRRQKRAHGEVARAENSDCQRFLAGKNVCVSPELNFLARFGLWRICDHNTEK